MNFYNLYSIYPLANHVDGTGGRDFLHRNDLCVCGVLADENTLAATAGSAVFRVIDRPQFADTNNNNLNGFRGSRRQIAK